MSHITPEHARNAARVRWSKANPVMPIPRQIDQAKQAAKEAGLKKYVGSNCIHNHGGLRYTSSGQCVMCVPMYRERKLQPKEQ